MIKAKVVYDGFSRPMIMVTEEGKPVRFFAINELIDGRWTTFDDEEECCQLLADAISLQVTQWKVPQ